ncbi:MAG: hypothetical protein F9K23_18165 [Bacteroidetes bacterium]|nr:MAG: hypothetical protein F9K23_18165 [Bacteroidota bacterium]
MGITMSGLFVRMPQTDIPKTLEELFDRSIVNTSTINCNYYLLFEGFNTWDIALVSDGQSSALCFGDGFFNFAEKLFSNTSVNKIPSDYLYYYFVESAMAFSLSYRKNGSLYESNFTMSGSEFIHYGDELLGLTLENDIAQDGFALAMQEFGIDPHHIKQATLYTFSPKVRVVDSTDTDLRYLVGKLGRDIYTEIKTKGNSLSTIISQGLKTLSERRILVSRVSLSNEEYELCKTEWLRLDSMSFEAKESDLITKIIQQIEPENALAQLVYFYKVSDYKENKAELNRSLIRIGILVLVLVIIALMIYLKIG